MNFITVPGLIGPVLGPPLGGFLTTYASWRWIFYINVPIGILGIAMAAIYIRNIEPTPRRPFDLTGFLLNGTAMASLMFGLDLIAGPGSNWRVAGLMILGGAVLGLLAGRHALRVEHPLVDVRALKVKTYAVVNSGGSMFRMSMSAPTFLLPLLFQIGLGMSAFASGMLILAHASGDLGIKVITTRTLKRFGFRTMLIGSAIAFTIFILACAMFTSSTPTTLILAVLFVGGSVRSLQMTSLGSLQFSDIPPGEITGAANLFWRQPAIDALFRSRHGGGRGQYRDRAARRHAGHGNTDRLPHRAARHSRGRARLGAVVSAAQEECRGPCERPPRVDARRRGARSPN